MTLFIMFPTSGCGAAISSYTIITAQSRLDDAEADGAADKATYEYRAANEYISKAREEQGVAHYGPSITFARRAEELAGLAADRARKQTAGEENRELEVEEVIDTDGPIDPSMKKDTGRSDIIIHKTEDQTEPAEDVNGEEENPSPNVVPEES